MIPTDRVGNILIKDVRDRLKKRNQNWMPIIVGATGSGKSYVGLRLGEMIDPNFDIDRVVFKVMDFLDLIESRLPKGSVIVFDEIGATVGARDWFKPINKAMGYVTQTYRYLNYACIFTCPYLNMIDINIRKLIHTIIETVNIDLKNEVCLVKWKNREIQHFSGDEYDKFPRITDRNKGGYFTVERIKINKPSKKLIRKYERKKREFCKDLYSDIRKGLKFTPKKKIKKKPNAECRKCGHKWFTESKAKKPMCPSCGRRSTTTM